MGFLSNILGSKVDHSELLANGATIIDVRSPGEFQGGHPNGAVNIPVQEINQHIDRIKKMKGPFLMVCASGMRSAKATSILKKHELEAYNAGPWTNLNR